ncbi:MAG: Sir2 silent information regulator family NAD-dependent deacetylase [Kiritimatiellae bacterium]|nr:Sir2 silent information regulator family NAD-dependent deacetylase [Kiritimatiellia bacterium]
MNETSSIALERLADWLSKAEAVVVGAGAGLSTSAGYEYGGERFRQLFPDFAEARGFADMYSAGFFPFPTSEEKWAYWSRMILCNRYEPIPRPSVFADLLALLRGRDHFVVTTNVDHCFQRSGFDKARLFYTQGDYGLWQCSEPCHARTYDNEREVREMVARQSAMRIPTELVPRCPVCGREMATNLRADDTFVEDDGWRAAAARYADFLRRTEKARTLFLDLGSGWNTPGIFKVPFWKMTLRRPAARYACLNLEPNQIPAELGDLAVHVASDIGTALARLVSHDGPTT